MLDGVKYQWASCLILALDRQLSPYYWLSIGDNLPFVACVEHTNFMRPEDYGGNHIVYLSNYVAPGDPVLKMNAEEVLTAYTAGLKTINPAFDPSWVREKWFFTDPGGQPVITANYSQQIPDMRTGIEGLYLANTTQVYPRPGPKLASISWREGSALIRAIPQVLCWVLSMGHLGHTGLCRRSSDGVSLRLRSRHVTHSATRPSSDPVEIAEGFERQIPGARSSLSTFRKRSSA